MRYKIIKGRTGKPILAVIAFLGRGNSGDEAMFQCIYEQFSDKYDIVAVVEEHGARAGFWDWYPYNQCERINSANIHYFENAVAGLIVGGGGLGLGFGAAQVIVAKREETPVILAGVDHTHQFSVISTKPAFVEATRTYMKLFDYISVRSKQGFDIALEDGVKVSYGADWALKLLDAKSKKIKQDNKRVMIVLREHALNSIDFVYYRNQILTLIFELKHRGFKPEFLPFSPEDERFLSEANLGHELPSNICWWDARLVKQHISCSVLTISVGRLHPMIYAHSTGANCAQLMPPIKEGVGERQFGKVLVMCKELGVPFFHNNSEFLAAIDKKDFSLFHDEGKRVEAMKRLDRMIEDISEILHKRVVENT